MEDFIEQVRSNLCLWDVHSVLYRDLNRKDICWENVARECGMESGKEAKLLWKRLRDSHREALRRRRSHGTQIVRPWKYEHLMEFVRPHREKEEPASEPGASHSDPLEEPDAYTVQARTHISRLIKKPAQASTLKNFEERASRRRRDLVRSKLTMKSKFQPPVSDAITELFSSMCKKTKQLPLHLQLRVQREMFESVSRAEEEALCDDEAAGVSGASAAGGGGKSQLVFKSSPVSDPESDSPHASRDEDLPSDN